MDYRGVALHQSRIERAPGTDGTMPDPDVAAAMASLGVAAEAARTGSVAGGGAPAGSGCFNRGVARMLTHWKEN